MADETFSPDAGGPGRGEGAGEALEVRGLSQGQVVWGRFVRHRGAMFGLAVIALVALLSFSSMGIGPIKGWWPLSDDYPYDVVNNARPTMTLPTWLGGPGFAFGEHPFGQDSIGHDMFAQVMRGVQTSLFVMILLGAVATTIGVTIGAVAGYYRKWIDQALMRFTDLIITLPVLVLGAVLGTLVATLPYKLDFTAEQRQLVVKLMPVLLSLALGCILWTGLARLVRSEFLTLREREFVDSARVAGASDWRIITKHILPNAMGVIIVNTTLLMSAAVVLEAALSYLGFGIKPPNMSLGYLISANEGAFSTRPWLFWWPGAFIVMLVLSINFIGDGLRDAFDPRTKRIPSQTLIDKKLAQTAQVDPQHKEALK